MKPRKLTLDDQLCFALYAATNAVVRAYRPRLQQIGLTYPQYLVMLVLWQDGLRTVSDIAARLSLKANAVTPLLDRLEHAGLIERRRDIGDRRVVHVHLTAKGIDLEQAASIAQQNVACRTGMAPEAIDALRNELRALVRHLEADLPGDAAVAADIEPARRGTRQASRGRHG